VVCHQQSETRAALVISRDPLGKEHDDFLFTTDCRLPPAQIVSPFADRWAIEDTFRNLKQYLGLNILNVLKARKLKKPPCFHAFYRALSGCSLSRTDRPSTKLLTDHGISTSRGSLFRMQWLLCILLFGEIFFARSENKFDNIDNAKMFEPLLQAPAWAA